MKRIFSLVLILFVTALMSQAAPPKVRAIKSSYLKFPHYAGSHGIAMGALYHSLSKTVVTKSAARERILLGHSADTKPTQATPQMKNRTGQSGKMRSQPLLSLKQTAEFSAVSAIGKTFTVSTLAEHVPLAQSLTTIPDIPFREQTQTIAYRGLALSTDGDAIRNILINGMRTQDVGKNSNVLLWALSGGNRGTVRQLHLNPSISLTNQPTKAAQWGKIRLHAEKHPILAVVKMRGAFHGATMEFIMEDIPADQIEEIVVLLDVNGNLTWCNVKLNPDNTLSLTPYQPSFSKE